MKPLFGTLLGYLVFSFIGVPLAIAGRVTGSDLLRTAWGRSAASFGYAFAGAVPAEYSKPVQHTATTFVTLQSGGDYEPSEACKQAMIRESLLNVYLRDDRIDRVLKVPTKPLPWQRAKEGTAFSRVLLKPLRADQLRKQGMEFSLDSAIALTRQEVTDGRIDKAMAREGAVREEVNAANKQLFADPTTVPEQVGNAPTDSTAGVLVKRAVGVVTFAGKNTVHPKGKPPYETFSVLIQEAGGQQTTFSGVDLKEKLEAGAFALGQRIELVQRRIEFGTELGGTTSEKRKNVYKVVQLG